MLRAVTLQLIEDLASQFSLSNRMTIDSLDMPRDVIYCPVNLAERKRQERLKLAGVSNDILLPYMSFYRVGISDDVERFNLTILKDGLQVAAQSPDSKADTAEMVPVTATYQADYYMRTETQKEVAVKHWVRWRESPWLTIEDAEGTSWNLPLDLRGMEDTSDLEQEYVEGGMHRLTFSFMVKLFVLTYTEFNTILTIKWSMRDYDGNVTWDNNTITE